MKLKSPFISTEQTFTVLANSNLTFSSVSYRATSSGGTLKNLIPWMCSLQKLIIASDVSMF